MGPRAGDRLHRSGRPALALHSRASCRCHPLCVGAARIPSASPSHQEILDLLEAAAPGRDQAVLRTLYATALRESELIELDSADLDLAELRVFVRDGKGPKDRYTLIDPGTAELLRSTRGPIFRSEER